MCCDLEKFLGKDTQNIQWINYFVTVSYTVDWCTNSYWKWEQWFEITWVNAKYGQNIGQILCHDKALKMNIVDNSNRQITRNVNRHAAKNPKIACQKWTEKSMNACVRARKKRTLKRKNMREASQPSYASEWMSEKREKTHTVRSKNWKKMYKKVTEMSPKWCGDRVLQKWTLKKLEKNVQKSDRNESKIVWW